MRFIGNKSNLLDFIDKSLIDANQNINIVADVFSGTTSVAKHFKRKNKLVFSNDILHFSYVLQRAYIQLNDKEALKSNKKISELINDLNNLEIKKGFFYEQFAPSGSINSKFNRNYLSEQNAGKIDAALDQLNIWKKDNSINENLYFFLLASIIEAIPFVSNIAGTYGAFLKNDDPRKFKEINFLFPEIISSSKKNMAFNLDSIEFLKKVKTDLVYFDPPYNSRQYAPNYHLLERVAKQDFTIPESKTGLHNYSSEKSDWCYKSKVQDIFIKNMYLAVNKSECKFILLSYNSEGLLDKDMITETLSNYGKVKLEQLEYPRFRNAKGPKSYVYEYLFLVKV